MAPTLGAVLACLLVPTIVSADSLPGEAKTLITEFESFRSQAMEKAAREIQPKREKLFADLAALQETLTKQGNLDGAVAVRNRLEQYKLAAMLEGVKVVPDPGQLTSYADASKALYFEVRGATSGGSVWGTDCYTLDSKLAMAAVHAGVIKAGEEGVVKVTTSKRGAAYGGSSQNGVTTSAWSSFSGTYATCFKVSAVR